MKPYIFWMGLVALDAARINLIPGGPYNISGGPRPGMLNVHLVPHSHDDVGWLKTINEYYLGAHNRRQVAAVQFIIDSVIDSLLENKDRKFIYAEVAYFSRWWRRQSKARRASVMQLLESGQLELTNGGWVSNDEATPTYVDIIDQHTMGATFIARELGSKFNPLVGWQVDPFGHSLFQAKAYEKMGMNAWFFGRSDTQDFAIRKATRNLETVHSGILAGSMKHYNAPSGFNWDISSNDDPMNDDPYLGQPNIQTRVNEFVNTCRKRAEWYNEPEEKTQHLMLTMGDDFNYEYAHTWYVNMDKLIHYANQDGRLNVFYSTPSIYTKERFNQHHRLNEKNDYDWFPYCDGDHTKADKNGNLTEIEGHAQWTGYFTSRPLLKRLVREASTALELCRIMEMALVKPGTVVEDIDNPVWLLWEAVSSAQHHDAVSGTAQQAVTDDYMRRLQEAMDACESFIDRHIGVESSKDTKSSRDHTYTSILTGDDASSKSDLGVDYYFAYYNSSDYATKERPGQPSGAYIFRPQCPEGNVSACRPTRIPEGVDWIKHRVENGSIHWSVGPIPDDNGVIGKEIVLIIEPKEPINNKEGRFFTDSNGFEWIDRKLNERKAWKYVVTDPVAGNYYPITAGISIVDSNKALVVVPDRSVGGSSLAPNQVEIMVHRRLFLDDNRGVVEPLNERGADGHGIVVNGSTRIMLVNSHGDDSRVPIKVPLDHIRPRLKLPNTLRGIDSIIPLYLPSLRSPSVVLTHFHRVNVSEFCVLGARDCVLMRIHHRDSGGQQVEINFNEIFHDSAKVFKVTETVLHGGMRVSDAQATKLHWSAKSEAPESSPSGNPMRVVLKPGDIRTFILEMQFQRPPPGQPNSIQVI
jgi:hypothetical protein